MPHACSLNYDDRVCSNFYDIWGDFMEATQNEQVFPTLIALKRLGASLDDREVTCMQQAHPAALNLPIIRLHVHCLHAGRHCAS